MKNNRENHSKCTRKCWKSLQLYSNTIADTIALMGYEVGTHVEGERKVVPINTQLSNASVNQQVDHNEHILIMVIIILLCLAVAVAVKYLLNKRAIV